jgi:hypothetical protein
MQTDTQRYLKLDILGATADRTLTWSAAARLDRASRPELSSLG